MPFYKISEMESKKSSAGPATAKTVPGELMKAAVVTYQEGEGPLPHFHPNEEQYMIMLEGEMNMILGEEQRIIGRGDLIHVPRNTRHGVIAVGGEAVFFAVKSPCGSGDMSQDYNKADDAEEVMERLKQS
ncbi:cupin domain-containing protein [Nitrospinota bacterium]